MSGFGDLFERLNPDPRVRGRQFEHICKWYLTHDPGYRRTLKQVWLWDEWPGRDGRDIGVDLVAEDRSGHLWAIQAKAYNPGYTVTKRDIDTFLSASATPEFSFRLLIASTDLIGANAIRTMGSQEKPVHHQMRSELERAEVEWPDEPDVLRAQPPLAKEPRPHQREAIDAVAEGFGGNDRGQMLMACGTGKTLTALWVTEHLASGRTLMLVPSLSLLKDTLREWTAQASTDFAFLPVCSDPTVRGSDDWVSSTSELGFPVTTDPAEIAEFLKGDSPLVVFSTYQSSPRVAEAQADHDVPAFDLVIADEAHRIAGPNSSEFATVLDQARIRASRRLFTTATPRYFTDRLRRQAGEADFELASMDDETKFGPVFHRLSFGQAIERDLLSDYQVAIIGVDDPTYQQLAQDGVFVTRDGQEVTDARTLASHVGLAKAMRDFDLHKTISFHSRINGARQFATDFADVVAWMPDDQQPDGELVTSHVSGKMTAGQRDVRIRQLGELDGHQRGLLSNARCLGEGIDVPTLDGVAFIDPRSSQIDIIQAVGRAIRKAEGKTVGTIILPVFIDTAEDPDTSLDSSAFKPIWWVLKALRAHDEILAEQLDQLRRQLGRQDTTIALPSKLHIDLPTTIGQGFAEAFEVRLVEASTASWEIWLGRVERYVEREGHADVPNKYVEDGHRLGGWCNNQRTAYKEGRLKEERIARLEALGFIWDPYAAKWEEGFARLDEFVAREGHANVAQRHVDGGYRLGSWCGNQRTLFNNGMLSEERADRLATLGFAFDANEAAWEEGFCKLERFLAREGNSNVSANHWEDGYRLGQWCGVQRDMAKKSGLSGERAARLEALGFIWDPYAAKWEKGFSKLEDFVEREGHANVPKAQVEGEFPLGQWCGVQRTKAKKSGLSGERAARLEALGFVWNTLEARWEEGFAKLAEFVAREGHTHVPARLIESRFLLGPWCNNQRTLYKKGGLSQDRIARLEALGFVWDQRAAAWGEAFAMLGRYVEREGHSKVLTYYVEDGFRLGGWCARQRGLRKAGRLPGERIARLEALPGWTWDALGKR